MSICELYEEPFLGGCPPTDPLHTDPACQQITLLVGGFAPCCIVACSCTRLSMWESCQTTRKMLFFYT